MSRVENEVERLSSYNPYNIVDETELDDIIAKFVTLIWLVKDKKLTKTTFFVEILENPIIKDIFKDICGFDTDMEMVKELVSRYPNVSESKFLKNRVKPVKNA